MEVLREIINQLITKTLKMKQNQVVQDPRVIKKEQEGEEIDWNHPCMQSQPFPEEEENMENIEEKEKSQDISLLTILLLKDIERTKYTPTRIKYSPTRIKSRNVLLNISYTDINKGNFYNENFILDVFILLLKNLNPFSLQRKTPDELKHEMVYML